MMKPRLGSVLLAAGAALLVLSAARAQTGDGPDINNGRFVAVGGALRDTSVACFRCHGLEGAGDPTGAFPRLADQSAWYLYKSLQDYASGRRVNKIMAPIAKALTDRQMQDVAAYYASIQDAPYPPPPEVDPLVLQQGAALSAVGSAERSVQGCVNCHGPEGTGMPPSFPYLAGQYASYLALQLRLWKEGKRDGDPLNVMKNIARGMTDEQIKAVSLYFASIRGAEITPEGAPPVAPGRGKGAAPGMAAEPGTASKD